MELKLADLEKENPKYLRKDIDGGIISEKEEIDRYKYEQYVDVVDNLLLGNYNEFGEYVIEDRIKEELIACRKVIEDNFENLLFVKSESAVNVFSNLHFVVRVLDSKKDGYKTAILELLEPIYKAKGFIENTQATIIKKLILKFDANFKDEVYKAFNIIILDSGITKSENTDEGFKEIIDRKVQLLYVKEKVEENEVHEKAYIENIEELSKTQEGKKVIEAYKQDENIAIKYLKLKPKDFKSKNQLLMKNIESILPKVPQKINNNMTNVFNKVSKRISQVMVTIKDSPVKRKVDVVVKEIKIEKPKKKQKSVTKNDTKLSNFMNELGF